MKRAVCICMAALIFVLSGCGHDRDGHDRDVAASADKWQEQYDLGVRYLEEGNYEEAIIAFNAAIETDPKRVEAYSALADAYIGAGDEEKAIEVLERGYEDIGDAGLHQRLQEQRLEQEEKETPQDEDNVVSTRRLVEETSYSASGDISWGARYTYDSAGRLVEIVDLTGGPDGVQYTYADEKVIESSRGSYTYDAAGRLQKYVFTFADLFWEYSIVYNAEGKVSQVIKSEDDSEGTMDYSYTDGVCTSISENGVTSRVNYHFGYQYPFVVVKGDSYDVFTKSETDVVIWAGDWLINNRVVPTIGDYGNLTCDPEGFPVKNESTDGWYSTYSYEDHG